MGDIVPGAPLAAVGEAPGRVEVETAKVFSGPSGREYDLALHTGGLERDEVTTVNVLACQPPDELTAFLERQGKAHRRATKKALERGETPPDPPRNPIDCCMPRLEHDLSLSNSKVLLAIGGKALQALAHHFSIPYGTGHDEVGRIKAATIKNQHGSPIVFPDGRVLCSSLHPAFAMRERTYTHVVRNDIARAAKIAKRAGKVDWDEPQFQLFPTIEAIELTCSLFITKKAVVTVDIETDSADMMTCNVRCVGLGAKFKGQPDETIIVVPFLWIDGRDYWSDPDHRRRAERAVRAVLDACQLIAHNGAFDTNVCQRVGLMSKDRVLKPSRMKTWRDSLLAHHDTDDNDLPHDLGFVARRFLEAPLWKGDADHKNAGGVARDLDLHTYNAKDVLCTSRIWSFVEKRIVECNTQTQFNTDTLLAPVAREMTNLGVPIDEVLRGHFSVQFNKLTKEFRRDFDQIIGRHLNIGSPAQLGDYLYDELGYQPPLNPQGYDWEEGDDWSTSTPALLRLIDHGVDERTRSAIEVILQFRACDKIRGTYIDGLKVYYEDDPLLLEAGRASAVFVDDEPTLPERNAISVLHPTWGLQTVPTGRWTSKPNVQNWASRAWALENEQGVKEPTNLRRMIVAPPGHVLVGADFEQIELRIYAAVANDELLLRAFFEKDKYGNDYDPHSLNAAVLFTPTATTSAIDDTYYQLIAMKKGSNDDKARLKHLRVIAKRFAFLCVYGGKREKLFSVMTAERDKATGERVFTDLTERKVREWFDRWHNAHPETRQWHQHVADFLREHGYVMSPMLDKRKRYFPGGASQENAPPNMEIQSASAATTNDSMLQICEEIPFRGWSSWTGLILNVHDQIVLIAPESKAEEACGIVERCMKHEIECADGRKLPLMGKAVAKRNLAGLD